MSVNTKWCLITNNDVELQTNKSNMMSSSPYATMYFSPETSCLIFADMWSGGCFNIKIPSVKENSLLKILRQDDPRICMIKSTFACKGRLYIRTESSNLCSKRRFCCSCKHPCCMMASSNGNIFRVTSHLCGEHTGHRWIPHTKACDSELLCFLWSAPE